jgi:hypothetical protein
VPLRGWLLSADEVGFLPVPLRGGPFSDDEAGILRGVRRASGDGATVCCGCACSLLSAQARPC